MSNRWKSSIAAILAIAILAAGFACPAWAVSEVTTIKAVAGTAAESFSFLASGDAQLGAGSSLEAGRTGWRDSLANATAAWDNLAFLLTAGDNINNAGNEEQLAAFLEGVAAVGLPLAPTPGNHDPDILDNFDLPNKDGSGNYWYTYGDALFVHLNSNFGFGAVTSAVWRLFSAALANRGANWRFVTFHHNVYSAQDRGMQWEIFVAKYIYTPLFELLNFDLVITGHDHHYTRSKPMKLWRPNPAGITYLTLNSGSGSKFYDISEKDMDYVQVKLQPYAPMLMKVDVTPAALTLTVCRTDTMEVLDTCTISK